MPISARWDASRCGWRRADAFGVASGRVLAQLFRWETSMFEKIQAVFADLLGDASPSSLEADEIRIACAALLVHCAKADG